MRAWMLSIVLLSFYFTLVVGKQTEHRQKNTYIVHMDRSNMPETFNDHFQWYDSSLKTASSSADMLYTYNNIIHGFSTRLTAEEAELLRGQPGILSTLPETIYELHTTRTLQFLGLGQSNAFFPQADSASEVIVGVLDTGVWPELKSCDDAGLGPVPSSWRGECETSKTFPLSSCNQKLIGASFFSKGYEATVGP